jgi:hypothetical protein
MIRKRVPKLLTILATAACIFGFVLVVPAETPMLSPMPTAGAQPLGNGYDVVCTKANDNEVTCNISGCPRVHEDLAGDTLNVRVNGGGQRNIGKPCGNTSTDRVQAAGAFTYSVQGCRGTGLFDTNECGAWSDYRYEPPAAAQAPAPAQVVQVDCPAGSPTPKADTLAQCAPVPPKACPPGSAATEVPAGQQCQPPTNAVSMNISREGLNANVAVTNNSALPAECAYTATKTGGLVGPGTVNRNVSVGPNGTGNITDMLFPPPLVSYRATVKCTATWDGKQVTIGESTQNISG